MAHTFTQNHIHVVFSTKDRRNTIPREVQPKLWAYLAGICKNHDMIAVAVGGTDNHAHILLHLPAKLALAKAVLVIKANSSRWMGDKGGEFEWQEGYGAFSVSASNLDAVVRYIENQEAHHKKSTFEEEFRALLRNHRMKFQERDVFG